MQKTSPVPSRSLSRPARLRSIAAQHGARSPEMQALIADHKKFRLSPTALDRYLRDPANKTKTATQVVSDLLTQRFRHSPAKPREHLNTLLGRARVEAEMAPNFSTNKTREKSLLAALTINGIEPVQTELLAILSSDTKSLKSGHPILTEAGFGHFLKQVPHLFSQSENLIDIINDVLSPEIQNKLSLEDQASTKRAAKVIQTVLNTAGITAPPDLWLMRHVLDTYQKIGLLGAWQKGLAATAGELARRFKLDKKILEADLAFLHARGYLHKSGKLYALNKNEAVRQTLSALVPLKSEWKNDQIPLLQKIFTHTANTEEKARANAFWQLPTDMVYANSWMASQTELEIGFRLTPTILALRSLDLTQHLIEGSSIKLVLNGIPVSVLALLRAANLISDEKTVTAFGARIFEKAPGPFGIIHTYHGYMTHHEASLRGRKNQIWVSRGENVAASQDANRKSFKDINDALDEFVKNTGFTYSVFIEHAVGQGEATRQRFERSGENTIRYIGADLEDAAIDRSVAAQAAGTLPGNMSFVRNADIGQPDILVRASAKQGLSLKDAVMVVGNGFHEARGQSNESMVAVFEGYRKAGLLLAFTEETGLSDDDLIATGWNTYNAGFRYVHAISGQGLRPSFEDRSSPNLRFSWAKCAELAGFVVLERYTRRARTIYPHARKDGYNPSISVSYFCVPKELGFDNWLKL